MTEKERLLKIKLAGEKIDVPYDRQREFLEHNYSDDDKGALAWRIQKIQAEFVRGHDFLEGYNKSVTIFGSARSSFDDSVYEDCTELARRLAEQDFAVFTGGGPGIMEAANKGAKEAGGRSVGININLPGKDGMTERRNEHVTEAMSFDYFFSRKVILSYAAHFYIAYPGGFGTMDELFEMLTLIQTGKTTRIPIVLVGTEFWGPLVDWIHNVLDKKHHSISADDADLFHVADNADEVMEYIERCVSKKS